MERNVAQFIRQKTEETGRSRQAPAFTPGPQKLKLQILPVKAGAFTCEIAMPGGKRASPRSFGKAQRSMAEQIPIAGNKLTPTVDPKRAVRDTESHLEDFNCYLKGSNAPLRNILVQAKSAGESLQAANEEFLDLVEKGELPGKEKDRFEARLTQADKNFANLMENFFHLQRKYKQDQWRQAPLAGYQHLYPPETAKERADTLRRDPGQKGEPRILTVG